VLPSLATTIPHIQEDIMSLFRIGGAATLRASRIAAPVNARFVSNGAKGVPSVKTTPSEAPTTTHSGSSLINKESPSEAMARHQPDYEATIDHGTSYDIPFWLRRRSFH
jgi:NADH dehydrogenase (ubiquinone) Fe-S protein 4